MEFFCSSSCRPTGILRQLRCLIHIRIFVYGLTLVVSNPIFTTIVNIDLIDNLKLDSKYSSFTAYPVIILNTSISHHFQFHLILGVNPNRSDFKNSISSICTNCYFNFSISLTWALSSHKLLLVHLLCLISAYFCLWEFLKNSNAICSTDKIQKLRNNIECIKMK